MTQPPTLDQLAEQAAKRLKEHSEDRLPETIIREALEAATQAQRDPFHCKARWGGDPAEPQDCDWPHCGCDPAASKVLAALQEEGYLSPKEAQAQREKLDTARGARDFQVTRAVAAETQLAHVTKERDEARFRPLGDNHHNAAACPHCNPGLEAQRDVLIAARQRAEAAEAALTAQREQLDAFIPDSAHINALPEPIRRYIHDLETQCDPAGLVRENTIARDTIRSLEQQVATQGEENARLKDFVQELADEPCAYGDNCPTFGTYHGTCLNCKARAALAQREEPQG